MEWKGKDGLGMGRIGIEWNVTDRSGKERTGFTFTNCERRG